jgi:diguanylate cyclase (GGDEF)-like protein
MFAGPLVEVERSLEVVVTPDATCIPIWAKDSADALRRFEAGLLLAAAVLGFVMLPTIESRGVGWWTQFVVSGFGLLAAAVLALVRDVPRAVTEPIAFAAVLVAAAVVASSEPIGMSPSFLLWPTVLLAYFSRTRVVVAIVIEAVVALGLAVLFHPNGTALMQSDVTLREHLDSGIAAFLVGGIQIVVLTGVVHTMTQSQSALRRRLLCAAQTDPLTGLLNRRGLEPPLRRLLWRSGPVATRVSIALIDLDHFKRINDSYGHHEGDQALERAAQALVDASREGDLVARIGGEEFVVVLPGADALDAENYARRVAATLATHPFMSLSISVGICEGHYSNGDAGKLLSLADRAMYAAKDAGRSRPAVWAPDEIVVGQPFHRDAPSKRTVSDPVRS